MISVRHNLDEFNRSLRQYADVTGKTYEEILLKQGGKLAFALKQQLRGLSPKKGQVRAERLAALKIGGEGNGVLVRARVREAVLRKYSAATEVSTKLLRFVRGRKKKLVGSIVRKGRRMNLQALMVERELNTRESGRGFTGYSSHYPRILRRHQRVRSWFGPVLAEAGLNARNDTLTFHWDPAKSELAASAVESLGRPRARAAIAHALAETRDDIMVEVLRRLNKNAQILRGK